MITKPNGAYRPTGNEWLMRVPKHWEHLPLRRIGKFLKGSGGSKDDAQPRGLPCIRYGDLYTAHRTFVREAASYISPAMASQYTPLQAGDALFAASGETIDEIGKSAVNLLEGSAYCGGDVIVLRPQRPMVSSYLGYTLDCRPVVAQKSLGGRGITVMHIYPRHLKSVVLPLPPMEEQNAIARFLDYATRRIDRYIRAKEKLIALLEEQKWAIVHEAATGQIDVRTGRPYSAYKPSVVDGSRQVPKHWRRWRLKGLLRSVDQRSATGTETLLSLRRDHGVVVYADHFARPPQGATLVGFKHVRPGQLVVNRLQANNGLVFHSALDGLVSPDYSVFEAARPLEMQYLSDLLRLQEYRAHFRREAKGLGTGTAGFLRLYDDAFLRTLVHLPPVEEQRSIVDWLEGTLEKSDQVSAKVRRERDLMKEFERRLVADAVTGEVDVRQTAADLEEESAKDGIGVRRACADPNSLGTERSIPTEATP